MRVSWTDHARPAWDAAHAAAAAALQQDWAAGEALTALGASVRRARVEDDDGLVALAQFTARRFGIVSTALCSRGPVWARALSAAEKAAVYRALKASAPLGRPKLILFTPDESGERDIGAARLCRAMTGMSTVTLDLSQDLDALRAAQKPKWRNRLVAAEKAGLGVVQGGAKPSSYRWLVDQEADQRRERGYRSLPAGFTEAFHAAKPKGEPVVLMVRADQGREACAAMLFLIHGRAATYHLGWANETGRGLGAHNLLLWRAIEALKPLGVQRLDLGGVDTGRGAGLARFKIGTGGDVVTLAGTYF